MTCRLIGPACKNGTACNPGRPARPVYMHGLCFPCWASLGEVARRTLMWCEPEQSTASWDPQDVVNGLLALEGQFELEAHEFPDEEAAA